MAPSRQYDPKGKHWFSRKAVCTILSVVGLFGILVCLLGRPVFAQTDRTPAGEQLTFGDYHALVIGNNDYAHLSSLNTAINDARAMAAILEEKFGFSVTYLENATAVDIIAAINSFRAELTFEDNLLIYYAGHGTVDPQTNEGFWLPVDAEADDDTHWIENTSITRRLRGMTAKHVMVISDSCYSGTLVRDAVAAPKTGSERLNWLRRMASRRSRTAMTSGANEPVADGGGGDHSVFAAALLSVLNKTNDVTEAESIYQSLRGMVALNADQTPLYDPMRKAGHENGEFLFRPIVKKPAVEAVTRPLPAPLQVEMEFWRAIANSRQAGDYQAYLQKYPSGQFAPLAKERLSRLSQPGASGNPGDRATATPSALELEPIGRQYVVVQNSNVRAEPTVESARVTTLPRGTSVQVAGKVTGRNWYAIEDDGKSIGYIYATLLQDAETYEQDTPARRDTAVTALNRPANPSIPSAADPAVGNYGARRTVGETFQECVNCPEMIVVPAGTFNMGDLNGRGAKNEQPIQTIRIAEPFAAGVFEITFAEWEACVSDGGCNGYRPEDAGWGRGNRPVINVSWLDATAYIQWLNGKVPGAPYRLLTEAEWEYVARAGTTTRYWWGDAASHQKANYGSDECCDSAVASRDQWHNTAPVGSFGPNPFGLYDILGNVWEWVEDCWSPDYRHADGTGRAYKADQCRRHVYRGGSWFSYPRNLRSASRFGENADYRDSTFGGFRVARSL